MINGLRRQNDQESDAFHDQTYRIVVICNNKRFLLLLNYLWTKEYTWEWLQNNMGEEEENRD